MDETTTNLRALALMIANARLIEDRLGHGRPIRLELAAWTAETFEAALEEAAARLEAVEPMPLPRFALTEGGRRR